MPCRLSGIHLYEAATIQRLQNLSPFSVSSQSAKMCHLALSACITGFSFGEVPHLGGPCQLWAHQLCAHPLREACQELAALALVLPHPRMLPLLHYSLVPLEPAVICLVTHAITHAFWLEDERMRMLSWLHCSFDLCDCDSESASHELLKLPIFFVQINDY